MTKETYMALYDQEPDEIALTDDDVRQWLDTIVDGMITAREGMYTLCYGKLDTDRGEYENEIMPAGWSGDYRDWKELHIYDGIDKLAAAVGGEIFCEDRGDSDYPWQYFFVYRGIKVFQIEKKKWEDQDGN